MFSPVSARAASSYRQTSAVGAGPHQLVSMLFESILQSVHTAREAVRRRDAEVKAHHIARAIRFFHEGLIVSLDEQRGGELASNLRAVYEYCVTRLTVANLRNDEAALTEVIKLIDPIAQGWREIGNQVQVQPASPRTMYA
jgi:flagellar secretion chaperone FliS